MEKASVDNLCWRLQHCNRCVNFFMFFEAMFYCCNELFTSDDVKESRKIFKIISTQAAGFKAIKPCQPISLHFIINWCNRLHKYTNILQKVDSIEKNLFDGFINSLKESNVVDDDSRWVCVYERTTKKKDKRVFFPLKGGFNGCPMNGCSLLLDITTFHIIRGKPEGKSRGHSHIDDVDELSIHLTSEKWQYSWGYDAKDACTRILYFKIREYLAELKILVTFLHRF